MSFKDIDKLIDVVYTSSENDLVNEFYIPVLSNSLKYDRLAGYFRSDSLAFAARGIGHLIENNGHMRLLCGDQLTPDDVDAIKNADDLIDIIDKNFLGEYENLEDELVKNHVQLLGWMIANGFLEIRIGVNKNGKKYCPNGILHSKRGLFYDDVDDCILFTGSVNETAAGWAKNSEDLRIDKSWKYDEVIKRLSQNFDDLWEGKIKNWEIYDVPEASKQELIKDAPNDMEGVRKLIDNINKKESKIKNPYPHQQEAIDKWFQNDKRGIFEMATGTGKTLTALFCLKKLLKEEKVLTVISCPYVHLIEQWKNTLQEMGFENIHDFYGTIDSEWGSKFDLLKLTINRGLDFENDHIILTIHDTFSKEYFINKINNVNLTTLVIVDEVHHVGASGFFKGLNEVDYDYRLGLSATPTRYMDYEGTKKLISYFDRIVFKFSILDALTLRNPQNNQYFLTPYCYHPLKVNLSHDEKKNKSKANNSKHKYLLLRQILDELDKPIDHLIIFCSNIQLPNVLSILEEKKVFPKSEFTYRQRKLGLRRELLNDFDKGDCKALVAIRCLNEGVDVPSTDKVIIMSSSPNPAEYVQRRGRVLRVHPGKEKAHIYDLIVIPEENEKNLNHFKETEFERLFEFIQTSDNVKEGKNFLKTWGLWYE